MKDQIRLKVAGYVFTLIFVFTLMSFININTDTANADTPLKPANPGVTITEAVEPVKSTINNYLSRWASVPGLQTIVNANGNISVLDVENAIVYEYSAKAEFVKTQRFKKELDKAGAFTKDDDENYYIFYAKDVEEGAFNEINMALVKYSPSGQKLKEFRLEAKADDSFNGVKQPFNSGTCRLEISDNMIAAYFARGMFKSIDGRSHQASYGFILDINTFERLTGKSSSRIPYVSHSFNQFVLPTKDGFVFVDHGDGSPRAFAFEKVTMRQSGDKNKPMLTFDKKNITSFFFKSGKLDPVGDNETYAEMGQLAKTPGGYIFAGAYEKNTVARERDNDSRNLFLLIMNEDLTNPRGLPILASPIWITNYTDKITESVVSPKIVQIDRAKYLLMWEVYNNGFRIRKINTSNAITKIYMAIVNDKGDVVTPAREIPGAQLNGYDALRYNPKTGLVHWATSKDGNKIQLYSLNP